MNWHKNYVDKKLVLELSLFTLGGLSILRKIEKNNFDTISMRPTLSKLDKIYIFTSVYFRMKLGLTPVSKKNFCLFSFYQQIVLTLFWTYLLCQL